MIIIIFKIFLTFFNCLSAFFIAKFNHFSDFSLLYLQVQYFTRYFREHNLKYDFPLHQKHLIHTFFSASKNPSAFFSLVSPNTVLNTWKHILAKHWDFSHRKKHPGRPPVSQETKLLVKNMKLDNPSWGCRRIRDELLKLNIDLSHESISRILTHFRKTGDIKPLLSWKKFLSAHWNSLLACDFFTADIFGFIRFYVFFIIQLNTRKIVQYAVTPNPSRLFLRNQLSAFEYEFPKAYLIHDNSGEFKYFPYGQYNITSVPTVPYSPNLNAYSERFVRSIRSECLDYFIIFNYSQLNRIVKEYVDYYNNFRPHQGLKAIPNAPPHDDNTSGRIKKKPLLFGLHHHYYRESA